MHRAPSPYGVLRSSDRAIPLGMEALSSKGIDTDAILSALGELVYTWEIEQDRLYWGGDAAAVLQLDDDSDLSTGKAFQSLIDTDAGPTRYDAILGARLRSFTQGTSDDGEGTPFRLSYAFESGKGRWLQIEESGRCLSNVAGLPILAYGVLRVIETRMAADDGASEPPRMLSRAALVRHLGAALAPVFENAKTTQRARSKGGRRSSAGGRKSAPATAFMLAGLSDLGHLNRTYGFEVADEIVGVVAARLRGALRTGDEIGRYSGNKLGIILKACTPEELDKVARRFQSAIQSDAIETRQGSIITSIKLGAVIAPEDAHSIAEVLQGAEDALAIAKKHVEGDFVRFRADIRQFEQRRSNQRMSDDIIAALNDRRIVLAYQPIACARSRRTKYHEGLVRLRSLDGRLLGAGEIIPQAEKTGLLKYIDMRVIELAVDELAANPEATLSINVDGLSMLDGEWLDMLAGSLVGRRVEARRLIVEITETALIRDLNATSAVVHRLHDLGIKVALDDFGAGHTSFRTLRNIPIDIIKIDGAFMHNIRTNKDDRFFVSTLVGLAQHLQMKTVAEWVREEETAKLLTEMGVDYLQGDLVGATGPLPRPGSQIDAAPAMPCLADLPRSLFG